MKLFLKTLPIMVLLAAIIGSYIYYDSQRETAPLLTENQPKPEVMPEPEVVVKPDVTPEPIAPTSVEPEVTIKPTPNPLEWIQKSWRGRIRVVTIMNEQSVPVYADSKQVGDTLLPVNKVVPVEMISKDFVTIKFLDHSHKIAISATDLEVRATRALNAALEASKRPTPIQEKQSPPQEPAQSAIQDKIRTHSDDPGLQLAENPPMEIRSRIPPVPPEPNENFEKRIGFTLISSLDEFREVIKKSGQKIRMKPGVYRAEKTDPPMQFTVLHSEPGKRRVQEQDHIFAVNGSDNYFDLRGVVIETPVSVQSKLKKGGHISDSWHINGANNTFEGGYFRNVLDRPYPDYTVTENEFEICNDGNTFLNCTFVIKGSIPYGYTDFYGKGRGAHGRLNKHSFMSIEHANNTSLIGCKVFMQSFGHAIHFHKVDGVLIKDCLISGTLRPTNDIYNEVAGRAVEYDFDMMYRKQQPIPRDQMIPLTEDAIRSYNEVKNITVIDTTIERQRGCFQLLCIGDITLENVTVLEAGDFSYDLSSGSKGKVIMKNCFADVAYNPVFNLTRGDTPKDAFYEVTILSPRPDVRPTSRSSLGIICGDDSTFILHDGTTTPLPKEVNKLTCGGKKGMKNSTITNYTTAELTLDRNVQNCHIKSVGPVIDNGKNNTITIIEPMTRNRTDM